MSSLSSKFAQALVPPDNPVEEPTAAPISGSNEPKKLPGVYNVDLSKPLDWAGYRNENWSPMKRMTVGNLATGAGLAGLGYLAVPALQWLMPDVFNRFPEQKRRLRIAAMLGGMALPWAVTGPTMYQHYYGGDKPDAPLPKESSDGMYYGAGEPIHRIDRSMAYKDIVDAARSSADPMTASDAAWAIRRFSQMGQPKKRYITPGSVAAAAIGAGLGGATGAVLAKGINFFFKSPPVVKKTLTYGGAGLGALLSAARIIPDIEQ